MAMFSEGSARALKRGALLREETMFSDAVQQLIQAALSFAKIATVVRQIAVDPRATDVTRTIPGIDGRSTAVALVPVRADTSSARRPVDRARQAACRS